MWVLHPSIVSTVLVLPSWRHTSHGQHAAARTHRRSSKQQPLQPRTINTCNRAPDIVNLKCRSSSSSSRSCARPSSSCGDAAETCIGGTGEYNGVTIQCSVAMAAARSPRPATIKGDGGGGKEGEVERRSTREVEVWSGPRSSGQGAMLRRRRGGEANGAASSRQRDHRPSCCPRTTTTCGDLTLTARRTPFDTRSSLTHMYLVEMYCYFRLFFVSLRAGA